eukprot:GHVR01118920.1.p1 GENE.GHVR01118920.1~~GHVR01118920.1.p1  ORF type:complete len:119 (+),score=21.36 GHVR01118920.1:54-410(+)
MFGEDVAAIVIDIGSSNTRLGFAGEDAPKHVHPSSIGVGLGEDDGVFFPLNPYKKLDNVEARPCLTYKTGNVGEGGYELDADVFDVIVGHCVGSGSGGLGIKPHEHPFLFSEPSRHNP